MVLIKYMSTLDYNYGEIITKEDYEKLTKEDKEFYTEVEEWL